MTFIPSGSTVRATVVTQRNVSRRESTQILRNRCISEFRAFGWSVVSVGVTYVSSSKIQISFTVDFIVPINWQSEQAAATQLSSELQYAGLTVRSLYIKLIRKAVFSRF